MATGTTLPVIQEHCSYIFNITCVFPFRDLKPSNIFLEDDLNICVGDFGVATVMGDVRTKTRTAVGMYSQSPEKLCVIIFHVLT